MAQSICLLEARNWSTMAAFDETEGVGTGTRTGVGIVGMKCPCCRIVATLALGIDGGRPWCSLEAPCIICKRTSNNVNNNEYSNRFLLNTYVLSSS